ncbi:MAG: glycosyltransferase family 2 protein [Chloroflexota bacterium]|nr:glycosyltransferase family 2 protein [Chloroflexota bacterium]
MRAGLFWTALGLVAYTYVGFPLLLALRGALLHRPYRSASIQPLVSLIIAARNEAASIGAKLANINQLDYPMDRLQVIVVSDGSDDGTEEIVDGHPGHRITLLRRPREGKAAALNAAVATANGEILVFSDSNSRYASDAVSRLVMPFADPQVGGVAGNQVYERKARLEGSSEGERAYWGYDRWMKVAESRAGSTVSATGAIYAIRRDLFEPIPDGVTDDFYTSVGVIAKGRRLVFAPDAIAYEPPATSGRFEFERKVRIMTRGLQGVMLRRRLLDPRLHGFYAVQLASHKVLRRLMVFPMIVLALGAVALWRDGRLYRWAAVGQLTFYAAACVGLMPWHWGRRKVFALPAFICLATAASAAASWNMLRGRRIDRWEPSRSQDGTPP